jgi:hypothetical protein
MNIVNLSHDIKTTLYIRGIVPRVGHYGLIIRTLKGRITQDIKSGHG